MIHAVISVAACVIITALALRLLADIAQDVRRAPLRRRQREALARRREAIASEWNAPLVSGDGLPPGVWAQFLLEIAVIGELQRAEAPRLPKPGLLRRLLRMLARPWNAAVPVAAGKATAGTAGQQDEPELDVPEWLRDSSEGER